MKQYTIGDVSKRLGISRDSLRFYEKKGIISPQKLENGYRCYSYEDTRKLLDIMFYRRLNFSIEDINRILHQSSFGSYYTINLNNFKPLETLVFSEKFSFKSGLRLP